MNLKDINKTVNRIAACFGAIFAATGSVKAVVAIDGQATGGDGYTTLHVQTNATSVIFEGAPDPRNALVNFRFIQEADLLNIFLGGVVDGGGNSILLFIDSKAGGITKIGPNQITYLDEEGDTTQEYHINGLAINGEIGMTFESGFLPDYAIRIGGGGIGTNRRAFVTRYDLVTHTFNDSGEAHQANLTDGMISNMRVLWNAVGGLSGYADFANGVEMSLSLSAMGVPAGSTSIKMMAIHTDSIGGAASNQVLGSLPPGSSALGMEINSTNFQTIDNVQTITIPIISAGLDPNGDADSDGLLNGVETNTGNFLSASDTGTDPQNNDSDDDGLSDQEEVLGTSTLGYVSNPNIYNHASIVVVNLPVIGSETPLVQFSSSLTGQYQWQLQYKLLTAQLPISSLINCKFRSTGIPQVLWGSGPAPGVAVESGNDISVPASATGIYQFFFDQAALTFVNGRVTYPNATAYLTAYGLSANLDSDGDGILNQNEFAANTDPTNADTDADGYNDLIDGLPLLPAAGIGGGYAGWAAGLIPGDNTSNADFDGDGFTNYEEYLFGTLPTLRTDAITPFENVGGNLVVRWLQRNGGLNYEFQESIDLTQAGWQPSVVTPVNDSNQLGVPTNYVRKQATLPITGGSKFFRVTGSE